MQRSVAHGELMRSLVDVAFWPFALEFRPVALWGGASALQSEANSKLYLGRVADQKDGSLTATNC
jgi:hypothetical protein